MELAGVEVDVAPAQRGDLAGAQPRVDGEAPERAIALGDGGDQALRLLGSRVALPRAANRGQLDAGDRARVDVASVHGAAIDDAQRHQGVAIVDGSAPPRARRSTRA